MKKTALEIANKTREELASERKERRAQIHALTQRLREDLKELDGLRGDAGEASILAEYGDPLAIELIREGHDLELATVGLCEIIERLKSCL